MRVAARRLGRRARLCAGKERRYNPLRWRPGQRPGGASVQAQPRGWSLNLRPALAIAWLARSSTALASARRIFGSGDARADGEVREVEDGALLPGVVGGPPWMKASRSGGGSFGGDAAAGSAIPSPPPSAAPRYTALAHHEDARTLLWGVNDGTRAKVIQTGAVREVLVISNRQQFEKYQVIQTG